jgi:threonine synthase
VYTKERAVADWRYVCEACAHEEPLDAAIWRCPVCGEALALEGPNDLSAATINRDDPTLWRYNAVLPVEKQYAHSLGEGMTPLVRGTLGGRPVWFKCDHLLPTGSFKDRGAAVLVAHLKRLGTERIIVDSSGNAAAAMAGYSAAAGLRCTVFAPATTSPGKLVQSRAFGAEVIPVEGDREAVARAAQEAAARDPGAFYASHNWHPVFVEGVKTWALEVWEQMGNESPAICFVPTGGGSAFVGAWRGFSAVPGARPQLVAAQPVACAPFAIAFVQKLPFRPITPDATIAEGTRIGAPARHRQVMAAIAESGGHAEPVSDVQLVETLRELWGQGIYVEPTAAVGAAACRDHILRTAAGATGVALGSPLPDGDIVVLLTGSGLKATETIGTLVA